MSVSVYPERGVCVEVMKDMRVLVNKVVGSNGCPMRHAPAHQPKLSRQVVVFEL